MRTDESGDPATGATTGSLLTTGTSPQGGGRRARLDAHVREIVHWHFSPETGCPFWLEKRRELGLRPAQGGPGLRRPQAVRPLRGRVAARRAGAALGAEGPRRPADLRLRDRRLDRRAEVAASTSTTSASTTRSSATTLPDETFPRGADWLMLGPTGPRRLRLAIEHLAQHRGGICFCVDLDPRWVNKLIKTRPTSRSSRPTRTHVIDQALTDPARPHDIKCMFTTPKLLEALCEKIVARPAAASRGIFCGGTEMTPQFHRFAREELVPGHRLRADLRQHADGPRLPRKPFDPADRELRRSPTTRRSRGRCFELVDPEDPERTVEYGETGRVMLTTLTREFFMPRFLERDEGERAAPMRALPVGRRHEPAPALRAPGIRRGGGLLMLHLPLLRIPDGRPYRSLDVVSPARRADRRAGGRGQPGQPGRDRARPAAPGGGTAAAGGFLSRRADRDLQAGGNESG